MNLKPILNKIIFQFREPVDNKGQFVETTEWGFTIPGHYDNSTKTPRWVNVIMTGPDCENIKAGQQVLLPPLRWTKFFEMDGQKYWGTDEKQVVAVRDTTTSRMAVLHDYLVFIRASRRAPKTESGLEVLGSTPDTPMGKVVSTGPKCFDDLKQEKVIVLFDDANFFNNFKHGDATLAYLTEKEIIAYVLPE